MFWKKKVEKTLEYKLLEKEINGGNLAMFLKGAGGQDFVNWLDNLINALKVGALEKPTLTIEELNFRKGEIFSLKNLSAMVKEIRFVKPESDETEE
jgi:hypothetical protein